MATMRLGLRNYLDETVPSAPTLSAGSWTGRDNVLDPDLATVARSADLTTASTKIRVDFGLVRLIDLVAVWRHTLAASSQWRFRVFSDSGYSVQVYTSGWLDCFPVIYSGMPVGSPGAITGRVDDGTRAFYSSVAVFHAMPAAYAGQYCEIEFDNTVSTAYGGASYLDVARLWIGQSWTPTIGLGPGATLTPESATRVSTSLAGVETFSRVTPRRVARFALNVPQTEAMRNAFEGQVIAGTDRQVFVTWDPSPTDADHTYRWSFLGRLRQPGTLSAPFYNRFETPFEVAEVF